MKNWNASSRTTQVRIVALELVTIGMLALGCGSETTPTPPPPPVAPSVPAPAPTPEPTPAPPPPPALTAEQRAQVTTLVARGRRASRDGDHAEALARFEEALAIDPHRAGLLCETGWEGFFTRSPSSEEYLTRGIDETAEPRRRAACLYNHARWLERYAEEAPEADRARLRGSALRQYTRSLDLRPDNAETQSRYRALAGHDYDPTHCPPAARFADVPAACAALLPTYDDPDARTSCEVRERAELAGVVEGEGPGTLVLLFDQADYSGDWTTIHLGLESADGLDLLGKIGNQWDRSCSAGGVEVTRARWLPAGEGEARPRLMVELRASSDYSCAESPWDECYMRIASEGGDDSVCEGLSQEAPTETRDERFAMVCASIGARYRCSAPGTLVDGIEASSRFTSPPEAGAWPALLDCPPSE